MTNVLKAITRVIGGGFDLNQLGGICTCCGSKDVSASLKKPLPFVKDGATYIEYRCRQCGHKWRVLARAGI